jgi:hypothetical protein
MKTKGNYDAACETFARYWLPSGASNDIVESLSLHLQEAVEDWMQQEKLRLTEKLKKEGKL